MRVTQRMAAAMKGTRMRELRALGFTSDVFPAKYRGTCAHCGGRYPVGEPVTYFEGFASPIGAVCANKIVEERRRAAAPKCGCGHEATVGRRVGAIGDASASYDRCCRCDYVSEHYFGLDGDDVTRESVPVLESTQRAP